MIIKYLCMFIRWRTEEKGDWRGALLLSRQLSALPRCRIAYPIGIPLLLAVEDEECGT